MMLFQAAFSGTMDDVASGVGESEASCEEVRDGGGDGSKASEGK
jgi:hypothetical protein